MLKFNLLLSYWPSVIPFFLRDTPYCCHPENTFQSLSSRNISNKKLLHLCAMVRNENIKQKQPQEPPLRNSINNILSACYLTSRCPERLGNLHPERYSELNLPWPWATWSIIEGGLALGTGLDQRPPEVPSDPKDHMLPFPFIGETVSSFLVHLTIILMSIWTSV